MKTICLILGLLFPVVAFAQIYATEPYEEFTARTDFLIDGINYYINRNSANEPSVCVISEDDLNFWYASATRIASCPYAYVEDSPATGVDKWAGNAYKGNVSIPENVVFEGVKYKVVGIMPGAFCKCPDLISVELPATIKFIGDGAFFGCTALKELDLGNIYAYYVGSDIVGKCTALEKLVLPKIDTDGEKIHMSVFGRVPSFIEPGEYKALKEIYINAESPTDFSREVIKWACFDDTNYENTKVYVPAETYQAYAEDENWGKFKLLGTKGENDGVGLSPSTGSADVTYFNLQGQRVENPASGIFIKRSGNQTEKMVVR